jgi:hypothetical protein
MEKNDLDRVEQILAGYAKMDLSTQIGSGTDSSIPLQDLETMPLHARDRWENHTSASGKQYWVNL